MRYGMNPHQSASIVAGHGPRVINGEPSMINYLDALNAFELVREADDATGAPAAASFKHVSPAGAALAGPVDATAARVWRVDEAADGGGPAVGLRPGARRGSEVVLRRRRRAVAAGRPGHRRVPAHGHLRRG